MKKYSGGEEVLIHDQVELVEPCESGLTTQGCIAKVVGIDHDGDPVCDMTKEPLYAWRWRLLNRGKDDCVASASVEHRAKELFAELESLQAELAAKGRSLTMWQMWKEYGGGHVQMD